MLKNLRNGSVFVKHKYLTLILSFIFVMACGVGAKNIYFESSYKAFFAPDNPQRVSFEHIQDQFTKNETILFTLSPEGEVFSSSFFEAEKWLVKEAWKLRQVVRVDSLSNFQNTEATEDELLVQDLVKSHKLLDDPEENQKIKDTALTEPLIINRLISKKMNTTGVLASIHYEGNDPNEPLEIGAAAHELAEKFKEKFPNIRVGVTGSAMLNHAFGIAAQQDSTTIIPMMYLVILVITYLSLRTIVGTIISLVVIIFSTIGTLGIAGHFGFFLTNVSSIVPTIVLTLAIADSIHILKTMLNYMKEGMEKTKAIVESIQINSKPVFLTSFTTVIGFLSLNLSEVPPYHDLGNMTAIGVVLAYLFSVTTLPALVAILPLKVKMDEQKEFEDSKLTLFARKIVANSKPIFAVSLILIICAGILIPKLKFSDEPLKYFSTSMEFRQDTDFTIDNLTGVEYLEISLSAKSGSVSDPTYLNDLENLKKRFENESDIVHIFTLTDIVKKLNMSMNADNDEFYRIPDDKDLAAQYLLLYELSLPKGLDLGNVVDLNKTASRVVFTFANANSDRLLKIEQEVNDFIANKTTGIKDVQQGSANLMFAHISKKNLEGIMKGALLSFTLITLILMFALRSVKYGLVSIISNILPTIASFGVWTLVIGTADIAVSVASAVTIGVIVDFTVHFLSKYSMYRESYSFNEAVEKCFKSVGSPIISTAAILAIGFGVLGMSPFRLNWVLGALSSIMIIFSVLFLFVTMPSILKFVEKEK